MKRKIIWLVLSGLMVATMLLASCAREETKRTEVTPPTTEVTPATKEVAPAEKAGMVKLSLKKLDGTPVEKWVEAPRYGGTVTLAESIGDRGWDDFYLGAKDTKGLELATDELLQGDWTRGPAGTEETTWWARGFYPQFETGDLAESWEVPDPETIIYHIRKGVHWQDKPPVNGRELTAQDVAFELTRKVGSKGSFIGKRIGIGQWFISATAVDKYTVVVKGKEQLVGVGKAFQEISDSTGFLPPEVTEKGPVTDWRKVVGTGPFLLVDNVEDSAATFQRNPNYWQRDPLFPQNQLPYVDSIKVLLIPDPSTRYAALRTGRVDYVYEANWEDLESLRKTNPELGWSRMLTERGDGTLSFVPANVKPFTDIRVRRALLMAIDRPALLRDYYQGNGILLVYPISPEMKEIYTPLEQLPESIRELYEYHPDKAKQLLAEAGYPQGFKFTAVLTADFMDMAQIYQDYLAKVGVDMKLDVKEPAIHKALQQAWPKPFEAIFTDKVSYEVYEGTNFFPGASGNYMGLDDPFINETRAKLTSFKNMQNQPELDRLAKELSLYLLSQSFQIVPPGIFYSDVWSPWVKNLSNLNLGLSDRYGAVPYVWIDQKLKAKMGRR